MQRWYQIPNTMHILLRFAIFCVDPFGWARQFFLQPAFKLLLRIYGRFRLKADEKVHNFRELMLRFGVLSFVATTILWIAVFMYAVFYYFYMPPIAHTRPVHLQFKTCLNSDGPCSFPNAHVPLTRKQQLLMVGQAYRVLVNIEMPESPQNLDLGMFMVCAEMRDSDMNLRAHSCRSAMMRYRSPLIRSLTTWTLSPLYVFGLREEFQRLSVDVFNQYLESYQHPITDVYVTIKSQKIQFYNVSLRIVADFTGLRYVIYNWPILSALIAISSNLLLLSTLFLFSWYHWIEANGLKRLSRQYHNFTMVLQELASKTLDGAKMEEERFSPDKEAIWNSEEDQTDMAEDYEEEDSASSPYKDDIGDESDIEELDDNDTVIRKRRDDKVKS